ncbi:MAG TPA: aminotransferase class I/II-fold pyridoxal phosphate-dependent enzyme [Chitinophagaceae bacterium]|nr:aminotransferase class I/II-fold pyridoxal phosphate-dependent enzyme [Chitinophagaceae bacterium]
MFYLTHTPGRTVVIDEEEYLFFSGYSYLGMSYVPEFVQLIKEGINQYGVIFPSSRISNTRFSLYEKFEDKLSQLTGMQETISFSSGYLAGQAIASLLSSHPCSFISPEAHPAVSTSYNEEKMSVSEWQNKLLEFVYNHKPKEIAITFDAVNTLKGCINDFSVLEKIPSSVKIICLIDDSHSIGLLGSKGEGVISQMPQKDNIEYILSYSLSKAFHIEGGAISCSKEWADKIKRSPIYTGSTPILPTFAYVFLKAEKIYHQQRQKLNTTITILSEKITNNSFITHHNLPIFILHPSLTEERFKPEKIIISSFGYPDPKYNKINRIVVNALHTTNDIEYLTTSLAKITSE